MQSETARLRVASVFHQPFPVLALYYYSNEGADMSRALPEHKVNSAKE